MSNITQHIVTVIKQCIGSICPYTCLLCQNFTRESSGICAPCQIDLPWLKDVCAQCAHPLGASSLTSCGYCLRSPPPFTITIGAFSYEYPIASLILQLKFNERLAVARSLGTLLGAQIRSHYQDSSLPEYIIPVPLHSTRLQERGYNQAVELARPIAHALKIPLDLTHCRRILPTAPQSAGSAKARKINLSQAFWVNPKFVSNHVALLDDVMTTGQTVSALASVLRKSGVARVDVWCCARTVKLNSSPNSSKS